uniref:Uncharacterized protein n=1 Tax=viral metagenome TaxID=1070528 RepID=A0A6M3JJI4_9ZZZZ
MKPKMEHTPKLTFRVTAGNRKGEKKHWAIGAYFSTNEDFGRVENKENYDNKLKALEEVFKHYMSDGVEFLEL